MAKIGTDMTLRNYLIQKNRGRIALSLDDAAKELLIDPSEVKLELNISEDFATVDTVVDYLKKH